MVSVETKPPPKHKNYISGGPRMKSSGEILSSGKAVLFTKTRHKRKKEGAKLASEESRLVAALNPSENVMRLMSQNSNNNYNPSVGLSIDEGLSQKRKIVCFKCNQL